jgi:hypothetical protein
MDINIDICERKKMARSVCGTTATSLVTFWTIFRYRVT